MKKMRKLIPAFAMLLVSAIMMSTASFAWFTIGTTAQATGMQIKASAGSALIISTSTDADQFRTANNQVRLTAPETTFAPATHIDDEDSKAAFPSYLKAPTQESIDAGNVDAGTGAYSGDDWANATSANYYDYTVYIATAGAALPGQDLYATVVLPDALNGRLTNNLHHALTIDFWVGLWEDGALVTPDYVEGTTVNLESVENQGSVRVNLATNCVIPLVLDSETDTSASYIQVTMRVYFDGALQDADKGGDYTYVRNAMNTLNAAQFNVTFSAEATTNN